MSQFAGYILPGSVMMAFGLNWSFQLAKRPSRIYATISDRFSETSSLSRASRRQREGQCCGHLRKLPLEGMLKLFITGMGIAASVLATNPAGRFQFVGDILFATVYLFFALSGLIDILVHYCPSSVPPGLDRFALALAFVMEGLVFHLHIQEEATKEQHVHILLVVAIYACAAASLLEGFFPGAMMPRFARAHFTLLHGSWFIQSGFLLYSPRTLSSTPEPAWPDEEHKSDMIWISLLFAWHCAGAFISVIFFIFFCRWICCKKKSEKKNRNMMSGTVHSTGMTTMQSQHAAAHAHQHGRGGYCQRCLSHDELHNLHSQS